MENRFGFKDFVMTVLLVVIIVMLGLKMAQDDRQWTQFEHMHASISSQTRDIAAMRRLIAEGAVAAAPRQGRPGQGVETGDDVEELGDPFRRLRMAQQTEDYATGDWIVDAFGSHVPTLNPLVVGDLNSRMIEVRVLEPLATTDVETLETVPLLARTWQEAEDGLSATFQLREGVTWSDGEPFTADDVVYTYEMLADPDIADGRYRVFYTRRVDHVEKLGEHEVRVHFTEPFYANFDRFAGGFPILPKHLFDARSKREIREHTALMLGTGPYRLRNPEQYTPGQQQVELVRNERYWGEPGPWDRMVWRVIEQDSTRQVEFRNGNIDMFTPTPEQHVEMLADERLRERKNHHVYDHVRAGYQYIAWNQQRGGEDTVFADKRVRQAMTMLIDRERMTEEIFLGFAHVADGPFHRLGDQHNPDIEPWPYDPERAVSLLQEAGFERRGNSSLVRPDGRPFRVTLTYPAGSDLFERIALFLRDNLARGGVDLRLDPQQWPLLLQNLQRRDFDAISLGWGGGAIEGDIEQMFHTRTIEDGDNRNAYSNPELDELIDTAHVTLDEDERMEIWRQCHAILHEDQPYTFLFRATVRLWLDNRIANVQPLDALGINYVSTWAVPVEWYVPADQQLRTQN